jgi:Flp pilus assembly protein TadB
VSKERARRRAEREAARAIATARRGRIERRRAWRRALVRRLRPRTGRHAWGLGRRSPGQRALIGGLALGLVGLVWYFVDEWPLRIAFWLLILFALPVIGVLTFDRKGLRL